MDFFLTSEQFHGRWPRKWTGHMPTAAVQHASEKSRSRETKEKNIIKKKSNQQKQNKKIHFYR